MNKYDLIIFDMDGTLVDTKEDVHICLNLALKEIGLPPISMETSKMAIGPGPEGFLYYVLGEKNLHLGQKFRDIFRPLYHERCADHSTLFDGMQQLLNELKALNMKCAIATNKAKAGTDFILSKLGITKYFDLVMPRDMVEHPKPAPDMILRVCDQLHISPDRAIMLGDTDNDILAAKAAGAKACLALWGYSTDMERLTELADFAIEKPMHLLTLF